MKPWYAALCLVGATAAGLVSAGEVSLYANGVRVNAVPGIVVIEGVSYAPLRAIGEAVGAKIEWRAEERAAVVCRGDRCARVEASEGIIRQGRLLLPIRRLAEALGARVQWTGGEEPRVDITIPAPT